MNGVTGKWKNQSEGKVEKPREGRVREGGLDAPVTGHSHRPNELDELGDKSHRTPAQLTFGPHSTTKRSPTATCRQHVLVFHADPCDARAGGLSRSWSFFAYGGTLIQPAPLLLYRFSHLVHASPLLSILLHCRKQILIELRSGMGCTTKFRMLAFGNQAPTLSRPAKN